VTAQATRSREERGGLPTAAFPGPIAAGASVAAAPHGQRVEEVLDRLGVDPRRGLEAGEVRRRRQQWGPNLLRQRPPRSAWLILGAQFKSLVVWLLGVAAALALAFGEWAEGMAVAGVLGVNAAIGFATELRAVRSMEALRRLARVLAKVRREGAAREVPAQDLVPGDIVLLEPGDVVSADLRLIETANLRCDESMLTGESTPVAKRPERLEGDVPVADRLNMAFKGTAVARGTGEGVVVATGMATELGRIARLVEEAKEEVSPLEARLDRLGGHLVWATLGLAGIIAAAGMLAGTDLRLMVEMGIALAVATVPEGLPIVATVALARGMWRMASRNALIKELAAIETLGATTVVFTDKTGTLTENRLAVSRLVLAAGLGVEVTPDRPPDAADERVRRTLEVCVLCNGAELAEGRAGGAAAVGDPLEVALLEAGARAGIRRPDLLGERPEIREEPFDPGTRMMATFHRAGDRVLVAVKGAHEAVLAHASAIEAARGAAPLTEQDRAEWLARGDALAREGLRVLALARKTVDTVDAEPYGDLTFLGLVALSDPPRPGVAEVVRAFRRAGVRVVMVTGDHAATARQIASSVALVGAGAIDVVEGRDLERLEALPPARRRDLLDAAVFARVSPEQKLALIGLYQGGGHVVAMTGDGVNDAPALKKADIGIAMGQRGTQVAREAADMVLRDDAFASILAAMEQGRVIFANIRRFVLYLLSCNLSEMLIVGVAALAGGPLPILPLQILYLNLVTDVFPALALGLGEGPADIMRRPPRDPREPILGRRHWLAIALSGTLITVAVLLAFGLALGHLRMSLDRAVSVSFLTLALAQLWHVFDMRGRGSALLANEVTRNRFVWGALALCLGLIGAAVWAPGIADLLRLTDPGAEGWGIVILASLLPLVATQSALAPAGRR
jgi:Ca2+-transporting ATPase